MDHSSSSSNVKTGVDTGGPLGCHSFAGSVTNPETPPIEAGAASGSPVISRMTQEARLAIYELSERRRDP